MGFKCGACQADVTDGINGQVWETPMSHVVWCNACMDKYDGGGVDCACCGQHVTHVDTLAGWCDICNTAFNESLLADLEDQAANGATL